MFQILKNKNLFSSFFPPLLYSSSSLVQPQWKQNKEELAIPILRKWDEEGKAEKFPRVFSFFCSVSSMPTTHSTFSTLRNFYFKMSFFFVFILDADFFSFYFCVSTKWRSRQSFVQNFLFWSYSWDLEEEKKLRVNGLQKLSVRHTVDVNSHTSPLCHRYTFGNLPERKRGRLDRLDVYVPPQV